MNQFERLRREKGYSQVELAALLGVHQAAVSKWETGVSLPTASTLPKLAKILDCTIDDLLSDVKTEPEIANG